MTTSFLCRTCGETHEGLPTDYAWKLPDEVWAIPEPDRAQQARWDADCCQLGERCFIRCVLRIPFQSRTGSYGWGIWVEVSERDFYRYVELYSEDARSEPPIDGIVANGIPCHDGSLGLAVSVQFGTAQHRPTVIASPDGGHSLAIEQKQGMSNERYHEVLVATGAIR
ncbi:DUF2199 domain-containing protein [Rhodanobacter sp. DHB23]|uniref:DUF2199 domain-containing protein n=1 Tax=Rhodanobacter sp. DHB23 TaxID=2775923 RepID=UPI00177FA6E1|nr:DUF2199 domain-containing protein [Rhodanobacter sp. DHB23]MBD8874523.1 DUF2199 domain-containing protein [Rhodanobacter sp. DHB23]